VVNRQVGSGALMAANPDLQWSSTGNAAIILIG